MFSVDIVAGKHLSCLRCQIHPGPQHQNRDDKVNNKGTVSRERTVTITKDENLAKVVQFSVKILRECRRVEPEAYFLKFVLYVLKSG